MAFSSGTFSLVAGNPVVTGTAISSTVQNNTMNDVATGLSTCLLKDGTQTATAIIPFASGITLAAGSTLANYVAPAAWTPTNSSGMSAFTITNASCRYARIGNVVMAWGEAAITATGATIVIGGLTIAPLFASAAGSITNLASAPISVRVDTNSTITIVTAGAFGPTTCQWFVAYPC